MKKSEDMFCSEQCENALNEWVKNPESRDVLPPRSEFLAAGLRQCTPESYIPTLKLVYGDDFELTGEWFYHNYDKYATERMRKQTG
jgi:hypothetical protein